MSNFRPPRGRNLNVAPPAVHTIQSPDLSYIGAVDRYVSELSLTPETIPTNIEDRIKDLLDKVARGEDDNQDRYRIIAYASALGDAQNGTLLALVFELIFGTLYDYDSTGRVASIYSDLCELIIQEIPPNVSDGQTRSSTGEPFRGRRLARKYLVDRCYLHVNREWTARKEALARLNGDSQTASHLIEVKERWVKLARFIGQLHTSNPRLLDQRILHWCLKNMLSELTPTKSEVEAICSLISNAKEGDLEGVREQMDEYHRRIYEMVNEESLDPRARFVLQTWVPPWELSDGSMLRFNQPKAPGTLALMGLTPEAFDKPPLEVDSSTDKPTQHTSSPPSQQTASRQPSPPRPIPAPSEEKFEITAATPLDAVVAFFKRVSKLDDYTTELSQAQCLEPRAYGGYAEVYRVTIRKDTHVAVKCIRANSVTGDSKAVKRTARELEAWSQLRHENILELLGLAMFKGCLAMVSAWMELGTVVMLVNDRPNVNRYKLSIQIVGAVVYLHAQQIFHGDIKGANVLVSEDGVPKLTDFGLTLMAESKLQLSDTDASTGTLRWMARILNRIYTAPELFKMGARRSAETDMYALGMTMLETLTGKRPFNEIDSTWEVHAAVLQGRQIPQRPPYLLPNSQLNDTFWETLRKCWVYDPSQRAKATEVEELLVNAQKQEELAAEAGL